MNLSIEQDKLDKKIAEAKKKLAKKGKKNKSKLSKEEKEKRRLETKLMRVITKAGLSWTSWIAIIEIADYLPGSDIPIPTACWVFNEHTKREHIFISTKLMKELPVQLLMLILKHEMLHKSMYRGIKAVGNKELANFALDAAINKILWLSNPKQAAKLGNVLFPKGTESRSNVLAIMNPGLTSADVANMDPKIRMIVEDIWWVEQIETNEKTGLTFDKGRTCSEHYNKCNRYGNHFVPDPVNLYNKMAALLSKGDKKKIKAYYSFMNTGEGEEKNPNHPRGGPKGFRATDKITIEAESKFAKEILERIEKEGRKQDGGGYRSRGGGHSAFEDMNAYFNRYVYDPSSSNTDGIADFIQRWETERQIEGVCIDIYSKLKKNSSIEPFPNELTRTGMELVALEVSGPEMPFFFNNVSQGEGGKKKVCCYFDTSPSMNDYIPYMVYIADFIDDCEECELAGGKFHGKYAFSEKVKGIPAEAWADFKNGEVRGGGGTSFNAIMKHANRRVSNDDVDVIIVFTDGYSSVSEDIIEEFNQTGKRCYTVYFAHGNYGWKHSRRNQGDSDGMTSDLDRLNGESFTVWCQKE